MVRPKTKITVRGTKKTRLVVGMLLLILLISVSSTYSFLSTEHNISYEFLDSFDETDARFGLSPEIENLEFPDITDSTFLIHCKEGRYVTMYSVADKQPQWSAYQLSADDIRGSHVSRSNNYRPSPYVNNKQWASAYKSDYRGSSYDRGHLVPSRDRAQNIKENATTYYFSNISPQRSRLNRGGWMYMEDYVRRVAWQYGYVCVVTGGIVDKQSPRYVGANRVTIPTHFFKVLLTSFNDKYYSFGYLMPNEKDVSDNFMKYLLSVNEIEELIDIDFFTHLPDSEEEQCENNKRPLKVKSHLFLSEWIHSSTKI